MGIRHIGDPFMLDPRVRPEDLTCFYCGDPVFGPSNPPFVHFAGHAAEGKNHITFHPECALIFARDLRKDGERAEY
jgi:hypothetical protein